MGTKLPHAPNVYDEGLQRTPGLERSVVTTAVWQVDYKSRYHMNTVSVAAPEQVSYKQKANHDDIRLKLQLLLQLLL